MSDRVFPDPYPASEELHALVARLRAAPFKADTKTVTELRENFERFASGFRDIPSSTRFEPVDDAEVQLEWTIATGASSDFVVLYFHGGGYSIGSIDSYRDHCARLSAMTGARVLSVGYRLAPEHRYPAALDDARTSYEWLLEQGILPERILLAGDSAGGGLALATLVALRDASLPLPSGAVLLSPLTDMAHTGASVQERAHLDPIVTPKGSHSYSTRYLGEDGDFDLPYASPVYADLDGLPPVLVVVGTEELLFDDSVRVVRKIKDAGGSAELDVWPNMIHIFPFFASQIPESQRAMEHIARFIRERLGLGQNGTTR
ncbi:alpha/beta hydrolase [Microbacterium sp. A93]|uniref:alpha/beta hydrolase n=1 Tax=Microbacterium sp. A93 TaxID=3450716 RepID=UPI003F4234F0